MSSTAARGRVKLHQCLGAGGFGEVYLGTLQKEGGTQRVAVDTRGVLMTFRKHRMRTGDSLYKIAAQYYGDVDAWTIIWTPFQGGLGCGSRVA